MMKILVLDMWHGVQGGAGKSTLYNELSKSFDIDFLKIDVPSIKNLKSRIISFNFNINKWRSNKNRINESYYKHPRTFKKITELFNKSLEAYQKPYDCILQIGSVFGPVDNTKGVPYFSYHDSTVKNPDHHWPKWVPEDFDAYKDEWYQLEGDLFNTVDRIMTYSRYVKDTLINEYDVLGEKISVIGSALKIPGQYDINWSKRSSNVLFVSTDFERKGGYELNEIFEQVVREIPDAQLTVVGNIPRAMDSNQPWLRAVGSLNRDELIHEYKRASILLHPAKYDPFPSVILEAANFEIPSVAAGICGIPEMINDGETGYLVGSKSDDLSIYPKRIITLLKNREKLMKMGKEAKSYVRERFHPCMVVKNMKSVFAHLEVCNNG